MDKDGNRVVWTVVIISAIAIIGLMFVNFMPSQTSNIKTAIGNDLSSVGNGHTSDSSSSHTAAGTNLLTDTGNHTVTGSYTGDYLSNETNDDLLTLFKGLEGQTVTASVDYKYSGFVAGHGVNRIGWEATIIADSPSYFGAWYYPKNDSGSGRISSTFVVPKNITKIKYANGYVQFSGSGTGTVSHLKIEKGSKATPWTP